MNYMPEMLNERKVKIAITAAMNAFSDANGDEVEGIRLLIAAARKDRDIADGIAMGFYRHVAEQIGGDRDGVKAGPVACATAAEAVLPAFTPTNSGAKGHVKPAHDRGLVGHAPAPLPERGEEGQAHCAPQGALLELPSSPLPLSKNTGGVGRPLDAHHVSLPRHAHPPVPLRKPSSIELMAARKVEKAAANTIFKTFMVRGRSIGSYTFGELKHTEHQGLIEAAVCRRIRRYAPMTYDRALVSAVIDEKLLKKFIDDATKEVEDAAA